VAGGAGILIAVNLTPGDLDILARTVYGEARGEPYEGKKAVAHVIINRTTFKIGDRDHSIAAAALRWLQFSAWNESDPNRAQMEKVTLADKSFRECMRAALEAFDEPDPTVGSRHYHTRGVTPSWSRGTAPVIQIGNHVFFNNIR